MSSPIDVVRPGGGAFFPRAEVVACVLRFVIGMLLVAMTIIFEPKPEWLAVTAAVTALGWSLLMALALHASLGPEHTATLATGSFWFDLGLPLVAYLAFLSDPEAIAVAALPLLVFRLTARYGVPGAVVGASLFAALIAARILLKVIAGNQELVRPPLILAWVLVVILVVLLALPFRGVSVWSGPVAAEPDPMASMPSTGTAADREVPSGSPVSAQIDSLAQSLCLRTDTPAPTPLLTQREQEVLLLLGMGHSYNAIASRLFISTSTVRNHVHNLRGKLELSTREEMLTLAREVATRVSRQGQPTDSPLTAEHEGELRMTIDSPSQFGSASR